MTDVAPPTSGFVALVDVVFAIIGFSYGAQVLQPIPKTYLSEIAFPFDFCVKLASSATLVVVHSLHWSLDMFLGASWHQRESASKVAIANSASHVFFQMLAWTVSAALLWMEHRRSRTPSILLRVFWMFSWIDVTVELFAHERVIQLDLAAPSTVAVLLAGLAYCSTAILGASCFFRSTPVTIDLIEIPMVTTPSAFLHSANFKLPFSAYGTLGQYDAHSRNTTPMPKQQADEQLDKTTLSSVSRYSNHSVSRNGVISATIPSSTTSIWGKNHFISYKVVVRTEDDRWSLRRQYSDFATLHEELPASVQEACPLPEDDNERKYLSWRRRPTPMKAKLEKYLQRVLSNKTFEPYTSQALCDFLEMEYVDEALLQSLYSDPPTEDSRAVQFV